MKNITIYQNEMNNVPFRNFNSIEMDLFFTICTKMKNYGLEKIKLSFEELKSLSRYKDKHKNRFINDLDKTYLKMLALNYKVGTNTNFKRFVLFTEFEINGDSQYVEIAINPNLSHILNKISNEFTKFELQEFTNLRSSYSKTIFRLLKQFRLSGFYRVNIEDFKIILDIPKSYRMCDIDAKILKPSQKELKVIFKNLKINKIKAKKKNKIEYLEFTFKEEDDIRKDGTKLFKDDDGNYYENDIEHFTQDEINKSLPMTE